MYFSKVLFSLITLAAISSPLALRAETAPPATGCNAERETLVNQLLAKREYEEVIETLGSCVLTAHGHLTAARAAIDSEASLTVIIFHLRKALFRDAAAEPAEKLSMKDRKDVHVSLGTYLVLRDRSEGNVVEALDHLYQVYPDFEAEMWYRHYLVKAHALLIQYGEDDTPPVPELEKAKLAIMERLPAVARDYSKAGKGLTLVQTSDAEKLMKGLDYLYDLKGEFEGDDWYHHALIEGYTTLFDLGADEGMFDLDLLTLARGEALIAISQLPENKSQQFVTALNAIESLLKEFEQLLED